MNIMFKFMPINLTTQMSWKNFLKNKLPKLTQKVMENPNRLIYTNKIHGQRLLKQDEKSTKPHTVVSKDT